MEDINNINTEDFISEIELRPAIWELSSDDYTNKITKKNAWEEVIRKFCPEFERKSNAEKNNIGKFFNFQDIFEMNIVFDITMNCLFFFSDLLQKIFCLYHYVISCMSIFCLY